MVAVWHREFMIITSVGSFHHHCSPDSLLLFLVGIFMVGCMCGSGLAS